MNNRRNNRFKAGSGLYTCRVCKRRTRDVGEDGPDVQLCAECYTLAGEENHLTDTGELYGTKEEVNRLIESIKLKGGDVSKWSELAKAAQ